MKKQQSLDGFVLKRRPTGVRRTLTLDQMAGGESGEKIPVHTTKTAAKAAKKVPKLAPSNDDLALQKAAEQAAADLTVDESQLAPSAADIEESLNSTGDPDFANGSAGSKKSRGRNGRGGKNRGQNPKFGKAKKPHKVRRTIKWIVIVLLILILGFVGYFVWKTLHTGGQIFQGNPLDMVTKKQPLAEDSNGRTNVLVFGTSGYSMSEDAYDGAFLTDSIMVVSIDQNAKNAYMISMPRDLWVKHSCKALGTTAGKLNESYYCGYSDNNKNEQAGVNELAAAIKNVTGLTIQYDVHADWTAVQQIVDTVGGVDVDIQSSDPRGIYDVATKIKYPNGVAHLNGTQALALARSRNSEGGYGLSSGNFDREGYQRKILAALQVKALSAGTLSNPSKVNSLLTALGNNLITTFQTGQLQTLIDLMHNIPAASVKSLPFVDRGDNLPDLMTTGSVGAASVVLPSAGTFDYDDIQAYLNQNLSSNPVVREAATIDVLNGSGTSGLAKTKADDLKNAGYIIGDVGNAPDGTWSAVQIYQLDQTKTGTAAALAKKFGVQVQTTLPAGLTSSDKAAFIIVFGADNETDSSSSD
ncbi:MAG: LCP family protein [Candidatus Nomurabacteria bacterium]|nr:LCP family protein [Candidatus Nomurabacteria bacterium]